MENRFRFDMGTFGFLLLIKTYMLITGMTLLYLIDTERATEIVRMLELIQFGYLLTTAMLIYVVGELIIDMVLRGIKKQKERRIENETQNKTRI